MGRGLLNRAPLAPDSVTQVVPAQAHVVASEPSVVAYDAVAADAVVNTMVVRAYYHYAYNERDPQIVTTTHADTWIGRFRVGGTATLRKRDANIRRIASLLQELPELKIVLGDMRVVRDLVIVRFEVTGHGSTASSAGFAVHRMVRGRIADEHIVSPVLAAHAAEFDKVLQAERRTDWMR